MAATVSSRVGLTFDELAHLTAGRTYNRAGDYRLHPENGSLPQRLAALPAQWREIPFPGLTSDAGQRADVWGVGRAYLFSPTLNLASLLAEARGMIVLLGVLLLWLLWRWSSALWGTRGGLVTLALAAFCPHLLAHSGLATSDIAASLGFLVALATWWRLLHRVTGGRLLAAGLATTLLALAKFSSLILAPVVVLLVLARICYPAPLVIQVGNWRARLRGARRALALSAVVLTVGALTWSGIWLGYGLRYSAAGDGGEATFALPWSEVLIEQPRSVGSVMADGSSPADGTEIRAGVVQQFVQWSRAHHMLPEAYLYGLAFTDRFSRNRLAYFAGEFRERGWREFFPAALALKTTLPALFLLGVAAVALFRSPRRARLLYRLAPLLVFAVVYWLFALRSSLNIGHRHLLPLYPIFYLLIGSVLAVTQRRWWLIALAGLLGWHALESWRVRPHYLTYFNQLAGGPIGGHRYFVDSSLDWGQGLPDLKIWLDFHAPNERVYLSYFGSDDPVRRGIDAVRLGDIYFDHSSKRPAAPVLRGGVYCVSATMLHRVYTQVRGPWSDSYEREYQRLRAWREQCVSAPESPLHDADGNALDPFGLSHELGRFDQLRFGRLCHFLELRRPDAIVANSVFIYRLSDEELALALFGPLPDRSAP